jgi:hypothetical protein
MHNEEQPQASPIGGLYLSLFDLCYAIKELEGIKASLTKATQELNRCKSETADLYYQAYEAAERAGERLQDRILCDDFLFSFDEEGVLNFVPFGAIQRTDLLNLATKAGEEPITAQRAKRAAASPTPSAEQE